ncbi:tetratricopeptide repeat protein [Caenimonas sedimenti]|nr:tetratricopeptide repeat protein [Caenimonas sedimenti]
MMNKKVKEAPPTPSQFMRKLRPELYSDTAKRTVHQLNAETLSHHLETITERNQTHEFEIFCRKLCERTICPNLKPATGPEGGGDSKADTETIPVADEISRLSYVAGHANGGNERWAFAFSAKQRWTDKARSDVAGIVHTGRGYQKIFFVTSRGARAKDRSRIEDELSRKYSVQVTILDRSWIVDEIIDKNRRDLAFNYLRIGQESRSDELGPTDFSRKQQLEEIERGLEDPAAFEGMAMHRATEALVAVQLARGLGLPRTEIDGRFLRAIRLADDGGTERQSLEARYEWLWTAFWWFDDIRFMVDEYEDFEARVIDNENAKNLEFLCNLAQLLFNAVRTQQWTADKVQLQARVGRLRARLEELATDLDRPNNALQARTSALILQVNQSMIGEEVPDLSSLWPQFSDVLEKAEGLGEFDATRLVDMVQLFGKFAGADRSYRDLLDQAADFVSKRTSEGEGALILLKRAQQLDFDQNMEMIRLLGKAGRRLTKKEYVEPLIDALTLLAMAYRSAGLLWAARAACTSALASQFVAADEAGEMPPTIFPTLMAAGWIGVELKHFPEVLEAVRVARGCLSSLPFDDESLTRARETLQEFDVALACQFLNISPEEREQLRRIPDILGRLELHLSRTALLYALGYEALLRTERWIPADEPAENIAGLFNRLAGQPASNAPWRPAVFNTGTEQTFATSVLGVRVDVVHETTDTSVTLAEAVVGVIEAFFATAFELDAAAHTERFSIRVVEADISRFEVTVDEENLTGVVRWPRDSLPSPANRYSEFHNMLLEVACSVFVTTCYAKSMAEAVSRLFKNDAAVDRASMVASVCLSRSRIFGGVSRLKGWEEHAPNEYPPLPELPVIEPVAMETKSDGPPAPEVEVSESSEKPIVNDHRRMAVRSVIDAKLWDRAAWSGTLFGDMGPDVPPMLAFMFRDREAAEAIFQRWRQRFGTVDRDDEIYIGIVRRFSADYPAHYGMVVTSKLPLDGDHLSTIASRSLTMEAVDDTNLDRFLDVYRKTGTYLLMPAIWNGGGNPTFLKTHYILKRGLGVKEAMDVAPADAEMGFLKFRGINVPRRHGAGGAAGT